MKKKKLNINDLKVESFITNIEHRGKTTVMGGSGTCRYESLVFCDEPEETVGCPAQTLAVDIFSC